MNAPARLGLYGLILVAVFAVAGFTANAVIDEDTVQAWVEETPENHHAAEGDDGMSSGGHRGHVVDAAPLGLSLAQDGYQLTNVSAPSSTDSEGEISLIVSGPGGEPVTGFELDHEQEMHLITVRSDGQYFRHVHPERDEAGTWSIPWEWEAAGSYRVFADFVPEDTGEGMTLSTTLEVAGDYDPGPADELVTATTVNGFEVAVEGDLVAGSASELTMTITAGGEPVTALEPYLGAFGHLVALRHGDLAYLHVHPHGDAPEVGDTAGAEIVFEVTTPTEGRYLLYLDFQVDGEVHTAPLVIDTVAGGDGTSGDTGDGHGQNQHEGGDHHDH
ncbi:heavy-metal-associated domain-containing protein [Nesterenkonia haasae]|uniref:heavy-metal-associated domain-containing protein n=1 Tax=Nesterenkonia haasae TaxID=2587813 RepID=UPI0013918817|nr:heavy-metal-associated domain-containing protein [Nesterenkonia haasae]NDK32827.1 heavy-metal-associated domain-containing protein [Nesterenkonia haasae]